MHSLTFLQESGLTLPPLAGVVNLYINNCANLDPLAIAATILATTGNTLAYATLIWSGILSELHTILETLSALSALAGKVVFENNTPSSVAGLPDVEGTIQITDNIYTNSLEALDVVSQEDYGTGLKKALSNLFGTSLYIIYNPNSMFIYFQDSAVKEICVTKWGSDGEITTQQAASVTNSQFGTTFNSKTGITTFDEFKYFTGLTNFTVNAFRYSSITSITLPANIKTRTIGNVFANCTSLKYFKYYQTFNGANSNSQWFTGCSALTHLYCSDFAQAMSLLPNVTTAYTASFPFYANSGTHYVFFNGVEVIDLEFPNTLATLYAGACYRWNRVQSITLSRAITTGAECFNGCSSINRINFSSISDFLSCTWNATSGHPFSGSHNGKVYINGTKLEAVTVPLEITTIRAYAFYYTKDITSVALHSSVTSIGRYAFNGCPLTSLTGTSGITSLGYGAFNSVTTLSELALPSITTIDGWAFYNARFTTLDFGPNLTSIGGTTTYTFSNGTFTNIIVRATTPPTAAANDFRSATITKIYVPYSADHSILNAYKAATGWSNVASKIYELDSNGNIPT